MTAIAVTFAAAVMFAGQPAADDLEQVLKAFLVPFSNGRVAEFMDYFADDATVFFPSAQFAASRVEGKANIARVFGQVFTPAPAGTTRKLIEPQDLQVHRYGDTAIATFHLGSDATRGRRTFVLRRIDSRWKIAHLHASAITVAQ